MKKNTYLIKIVLAIFIINLTISFFFYKARSATTGKVSLTKSVEVIEIGDEVEITVNLQDIKTAAYSFYLYFDENKVEYISGEENTNVLQSKLIHIWYDKEGGRGSKNGEIAKFRFKAKENGIANFVLEGDFYTESGQQIETESVQLQVQIGKDETVLERQALEEAGTDSTKNNSDLKDLRIDIEGIVPSFDKNILNYDLVIGNEINQIEVLAIAENPNSTVNVSGNTNLVEGLNTIKIEVISEDKTNVKNYNIQVTKTANAELANTNLETLAIENVTLNKPFENTTTRYETEVSKDTQSLRILAIPENEGATVEISGKDDLQEGNNLVVVTVTAQNGFTKRQYEINVYKRNEEEEEKYNQEQEENKNNLEQIFEAQKTSVEESESSQEKIGETKQIKQMLIILILTAIIIFIIITIVKIINKKRGRK